MIGRVTKTVTDSSVYQNVSGFFSQPANANQPSAVHTRFHSAVELSEVAKILDKLIAKKDQLKKLADTKGNQSEEFATYTVMNHVIEQAHEHITAFNALPMKPDMFSNLKDMQGLMQQLHDILTVSEQDQETVNSVFKDKPLARNAALTVAMLSLPVLPFFVFGASAAAALWGVSGLLAIKPTNDYLLSVKAINWDTESKELLMGFIETVDKTNTSLAEYIQANEAPPVNSPAL